jgi:hypothetical protein
MFEMLQDELVPLSVAGSLAYFDLNRVKGEAGSDEHLRDVVDLAVVALAYVAPIHQKTGDAAATSVLSGMEVDEMLLAPIRQGKKPPNLDCLYIRRSDLEAAVRNLQKCTEHGPFRRP